MRSCFLSINFQFSLIVAKINNSLLLVQSQRVTVTRAVRWTMEYATRRPTWPTDWSQAGVIVRPMSKVEGATRAKTDFGISANQIQTVVKVRAQILCKSTWHPNDNYNYHIKYTTVIHWYILYFCKYFVNVYMGIRYIYFNVAFPKLFNRRTHMKNSCKHF